MTQNKDEFSRQIQRRAIAYEIGGFRPPEDPMASFFGRVNFAANGEGWPMDGEAPMLPLAQINLTTLPFRPARLDDIQFITIFISGRSLPLDTENGQKWCLRTYKKLSELVPLVKVSNNSQIKELPMRATVVENDYPCWDDVADICPTEIAEDYLDLFENVSGFKLGGWPTLIQSEIFWAPHNIHPAAPEYVFQIDSSEKANWAWGDGGVGYFGRGTKNGHEDQWALAWQCL
jgi:uncharacterized protein YwqG